MFLKALSTPTFIEMSRLRGLIELNDRGCNLSGGTEMTISLVRNQGSGVSASSQRVGLETVEPHKAIPMSQRLLNLAIESSPLLCEDGGDITHYPSALSDISLKH